MEKIAIAIAFFIGYIAGLVTVFFVGCYAAITAADRDSRE